tara:strand:+ start:168 stop:659 length:492 start_codon:yes stop_codon:yes gene_type:complete
MVSIYLIEDINDFKYVGSTIQKLDKRLDGHRSHKRTESVYCSSSKLNLDNCIIIELEKCNEEQRKERERYYINNIDCVNQKKLNGVDKDKKKEYNKEYKLKNKDKKKEHDKEYRKEYQKLDWYCSDCDCNVKRGKKARHLKTKKHQLKINVCINKDDSKKVCN